VQCAQIKSKANDRTAVVTLFEHNVVQCGHGHGKETMSVLVMIVVGLVVGAVAKLLMPGADPGGMIITILLGIGGSLVAGLLGRSLGWYTEGAPVGFIPTGSLIPM